MAAPNNILNDAVLNIDTPENVAFGYDVAGIGSRFLAALVDSLIIAILLVVVFVTGALLTNMLFDNLDNSATGWIVALMGLVAFAFLWGYYIFFELLWNGQSPGKRWVGLRVIKTDGTPITLSESIIRNLVRLIDFLPAYYGLGVVVMFINDQARRLGDLAAGTLVVRDKVKVTLESLGQQASRPFPGPPPLAASDSDLAVERLTEADIRMAEDFLRRSYELANQDQLGRQILRALHKRMDTPTDFIIRNPGRDINQIVRAWRKHASIDDN
jgi:uncharacterized RDD family membrane protein YckC